MGCGFSFGEEVPMRHAENTRGLLGLTVLLLNAQCHLGETCDSGYIYVSLTRLTRCDGRGQLATRRVRDEQEVTAPDSPPSRPSRPAKGRRPTCPWSAHKDDTWIQAKGHTGPGVKAGVFWYVYTNKSLALVFYVFWQQHNENVFFSYLPRSPTTTKPLLHQLYSKYLDNMVIQLSYDTYLSHVSGVATKSSEFILFTSSFRKWHQMWNNTSKPLVYNWQ